MVVVPTTAKQKEIAMLTIAAGVIIGVLVVLGILYLLMWILMG
jgi:hypothetical protein